MRATIVTQNESETLIKARVHMQTDAAILVQGVTGHNVWLPLSQVEIVSDNGTTDADNVTEILVPDWLVQKHPLV